MNARQRTARQAALRFFTQEAPGAVGKVALGAYQLVLAEEIAEQRDWSVAWEQEENLDLSWCDACAEDAPGHRRAHAEETYCAVLRDADDRPMDCIGNVDRPSASDRRVYAAQLALDQLWDEWYQHGGGHSGTQPLATYLRGCADRPRRIARAERATAPHGRCAMSRTCIEHAANRRVPSCKKRGRVQS